MKTLLLVSVFFIRISARPAAAKTPPAGIGECSMKRPGVWIFLLAAVPLAGQPLAERVAHKDPAKYRQAKRVHGGAGELHYMGMFDAQTLGTNLLFLHRGVLPPKGGIGHHFHNEMEEMFVIFDGEAEFTINGRTARLAGPAGAPCPMRHSHAIYNPTDKPVEWMNIAVSMVKGKYDAFDLGDDRVGAPLDKIPVFMTMRLDRSLLQPVERMNGGKGTARYRRVLASEVFVTNWSYVDHILLPPGASIGPHLHRGVEEFYYVLSGEGLARVNQESVTIRKDDAVPIRLGEVHSFENAGSGELEFMVVGIAARKGALDTTDVK
jgi:mannose-6-phosphate isomerase-like protein (cupin superfamily)